MFTFANIMAGRFNLFFILARPEQDHTAEFIRFKCDHFQTGTKLPYETPLVIVFNFKGTRSKCQRLKLMQHHIKIHA